MEVRLLHLDTGPLFFLGAVPVLITMPHFVYWCIKEQLAAMSLTRKWILLIFTAVSASLLIGVWLFVLLCTFFSEEPCPESLERPRNFAMIFFFPISISALQLSLVQTQGLQVVPIEAAAAGEPLDAVPGVHT